MRIVRRKRRRKEEKKKMKKKKKKAVATPQTAPTATLRKKLLKDSKKISDMCELQQEHTDGRCNPTLLACRGDLLKGTRG